MILILMCVSGVGKTTLGQALSAALDWPFFDGDAFHPQANVDKMARGVALTDADREPWLRALHGQIATCVDRGEHAIVACSALKRAYRILLVGDLHDVHIVYLQGTLALIQQRLTERRGHFMPAGLLASQFETLEEPEDTLTLDVTHPPEILVRCLRQTFGIVSRTPI